MPSEIYVDKIMDQEGANSLFEQSGSNWVSGSGFPVGHIVSSDFGVRANTSDIGHTSTSFLEAHEDLRIAITPTSPNKIFLMMLGGMPRSYAGRSQYCSFGIITGATNVHTGGSLATANLGASYGLEEIQGTDAHHPGGHSYGFLYTPSSYGSEIVFTPTYKSTSSGNYVYFTEGAPNAQYLMCTAFEIKQ